MDTVKVESLSVQGVGYKVNPENEREPGWERKLVTELAQAALIERRRTRRWGIFFKLLTFLYLAVVVDAFSRRVVGWAMATHLRTELVLEALGMALKQRRAYGVIHHSDQGCQYTSIAFGKRCKEMGVRPSMGSAGDCYDNAVIESFWSRMQVELLDTRRWKTRVELANAIFEYLEIFHNRRRRHSSLGMISPVEYELRNAS